MTKKEITNILKVLKKFNWTIITNNTHRRMNESQKNWVDHVIFNQYIIVFVEVKLGKDVLSKGQIDTMKKLKLLSERTPRLEYHIIHDNKEATDLVEHLLSLDLC